jgi:hypothetical protein
MNRRAPTGDVKDQIQAMRELVGALWGADIVSTSAFGTPEKTRQIADSMLNFSAQFGDAYFSGVMAYGGALESQLGMVITAGPYVSYTMPGPIPGSSQVTEMTAQIGIDLMEQKFAGYAGVSTQTETPVAEAGAISGSVVTGGVWQPGEEAPLAGQAGAQIKAHYGIVQVSGQVIMGTDDAAHLKFQGGLGGEIDGYGGSGGLEADVQVKNAGRVAWGAYAVAGAIEDTAVKKAVGAVARLFGKPVLLDLDGNGVQITQLSQSNQFFDTAGDGYQHRTAWAGVGDAVLAFDAQNDGKIDQKNEIVFTEWDKTAKSDMQALRDVFDTNQNGQLDSGDAQFAQFKLLVTNADGTTTLETLAAAGISSIALIEDEVEITLPDGSKITGQTKYTKTGGGTGIAATVSLATETQGYALDHTESTSGTIKTIDNKQRNADGSIASETQEKYDSSTKIDTMSFDNDGDGVWDRVQSMDRSVAGTVTVTNATNAGILIDKTQTVTSGSTVTISRDLSGQGYYGQVETQTTAADKSVSIAITDKNADGSTIDQTARTTAVDAASGEILSRGEAIDRNGDSIVDWSETDITAINADKSRTDTVTDKAGSSGGGVKISQTVTATSADGQSKATGADLDGDGDVDLISVSDITSNTVSGTTTTSADGLTVTTQTDADGNDRDGGALDGWEECLWMRAAGQGCALIHI